MAEIGERIMSWMFERMSQEGETTSCMTAKTCSAEVKWRASGDARLRLCVDGISLPDMYFESPKAARSYAEVVAAPLLNRTGSLHGNAKFSSDLCKQEMGGEMERKLRRTLAKGLRI